MNIEIVDSPDLDMIRGDLKAVRGRVSLVMARHFQPKVTMGNAIAVLKELIQHVFGLNVAFEKLPMLTTDEAYRTASGWLEKDLAYDAEIMTPDEAGKYLKGFFAMFRNPTYFSNRWEDGTWHSITKATFDAVLLVMDPKHAGLLVIQDED